MNDLFKTKSKQVETQIGEIRAKQRKSYRREKLNYNIFTLPPRLKVV